MKKQCDEALKVARESCDLIIQVASATKQHSIAKQNKKLKRQLEREAKADS